MPYTFKYICLMACKWLAYIRYTVYALSVTANIKPSSVVEALEVTRRVLRETLTP